MRIFKKDNWSLVSLFKFQQIDAINANTSLDDTDRTLFSTCVVFDLTEYQLDNMPLKKANKLIRRITKIFTTEFKTVPQKKIGKWLLNYDISKMTFGQYIEISFYLSIKPIAHAHKIMASIAHEYGMKNNAEEHEAKADFFLTQPVEKITGSLAEVIKTFKAFNDQYKDLFGLDVEVHGVEAQVNKFNKRYGWIYAASQVAEYERIPLDQAYALPVRTAMHDLTFLKAKAKYESEQIKSNGRQ